MRPRWRKLFGSSLLTLIGLVWFTRRFELSPASWLNVQLIGMVAAAGFGCAGMLTRTHKRWLAAAALVAAAPMGQALYRSVSSLPQFIGIAGVSGLLILAGAAGTIGFAIHILVVPPPPAPPDPVPRARST